jgi:hypothetical protein
MRQPRPDAATAAQILALLDHAAAMTATPEAALGYLRGFCSAISSAPRVPREDEGSPRTIVTETWIAPEHRGPPKRGAVEVSRMAGAELEAALEARRSGDSSHALPAAQPVPALPIGRMVGRKETLP